MQQDGSVAMINCELWTETANSDPICVLIKAAVVDTNFSH